MGLGNKMTRSHFLASSLSLASWDSCVKKREMNDHVLQYTFAFAEYKHTTGIKNIFLILIMFTRVYSTAFPLYCTVIYLTVIYLSVPVLSSNPL